MEKVIKMNDVSWRREQRKILHDINWNVSKQEHWAVLGLNGSGKTSLLNMVNGYIWPTTGEVAILGKRFGKTDIRELRKTIGWVSSALKKRINERHLAEEIVMSGKFASIGVFGEPTKADEEKSYVLMKQLHVDHAIGQAYVKCSQGEKQKVLIARALMAEPELLILDEPTNGLDFIAREELLSTIKQIGGKADAPTIIFVTHHIEEVLPTFSHVLALEKGTVFVQGKREAILTGETLSSLYKRNISVIWRDNRAWMAMSEE